MAKWTAQHEAPEPLEGPIVATVTGGTILWFALFLVQLPFYGWFADHDLLWWVWCCAAGGVLGLIGIWYVRGRDAALKRHAAARAAETPQSETPQSETAQSETAQSETPRSETPRSETPRSGTR
ncbi:DUF2530 domain-containing protein [Streptomyces sp. NPDC059917]|uniref:DUF2530 domain-containing protein n=1 Tax=Streptomyces sp. NPDC059917 TaxID=3347002 RepID=UPI00364E4D3C